MTTPPPPPGNDPYGQQPPNPYGGGPGGSPYGNPYGAPTPPGAAAPTDGVSIAAFVLSLLCCGPVSIVLGIVGMKRTKGGQRKGRWAAVVGMVVGIIGILGVGGVVLVSVLFLNTQVTPDNAEVGQCINIREDGNTVYLTKKDCSDDHDGEIVYVDEVGSIEEANPDLMPTDINDLTDAAISQTVCSALMDPEDAEKVGEDLDWGLALEDPNDPADDDTFICYVESDDKLDEAIL